MDDKIKEQLEMEELSPFHKALLQHCKSLIDTSRSKMQDYYKAWDAIDATYWAELAATEADKKARDRKEPGSLVVPTTYMQAQTFIAFCFSMFFQKEILFEVSGTGPEDEEPAKTAEAVVEHNLNYCQFDSKLYQYLLNIAKYGVGVLKTSWTRETQQVMTEVVTDVPSFFGESSQSTQLMPTEQTKFLGTKVLCISPYKFFPDTRLPLSRFQEGEFVGSEDTVTMVEMRRLQNSGEVAGIDFLKAMTSRDLGSRNQRSGKQDLNPLSGSDNDGFEVVLTEVQCVINPKKFLIEGKPMGDGPPEKWNIWYCNDQRIVKAEPMGYLHNEYTYAVGQYSQDDERVVSGGLGLIINALQDMVNWFMNSRVAAVRRTINNWLVVDPEGIIMEDLENRRPVIRLKPGKVGMGVDRFIKQLQVQDTTVNHLKDIEVLQTLIQQVTGINETALGQFASGRRSATEAKNVSSAAAARLRVAARLIFNNSLIPMARQIISNSRQGLDEEMLIKIIGKASPMFVPITKEALVGNYDFAVFDGTMPSERQYQSQVLEEVLQTVLTNPQAALVLQYNPKALMDEILRLRGIRNAERFHLPPMDANGQPLINGATSAPGQSVGSPDGGLAFPGPGPGAIAA